ncbi:divalent-cation tolerance protein CutA [Shewanella sp.]|uniref:divalent-cation tolerance protein CutA n=1 Tax=Shewanella sp. TaxID=50422 RepID=UPI0040543EF4
MPTTALMVLTTCPDKAMADAIAKRLIETGLAACVQLGQSVESYYAWQGAVCQSVEVPLQIKCLAVHYHAIEQLIMEQHSYQVPEIIALPIEQGLTTYLQWIEETSQS